MPSIQTTEPSAATSEAVRFLRIRPTQAHQGRDRMCSTWCSSNGKCRSSDNITQCTEPNTRAFKVETKHTHTGRTFYKTPSHTQYHRQQCSRPPPKITFIPWRIQSKPMRSCNVPLILRRFDLVNSTGISRADRFCLDNKIDRFNYGRSVHKTGSPSAFHFVLVYHRFWFN